MTSSPSPDAPSAASGNGAAPRGNVILSLDGVTAGYGGGDILKEVSFTVAEREIMCIVGPNGAGKSTLLATISGVLRPRRGAIAFHGDSLVGLAPRQVLAKGIVLVPQAHSLFPDMTVRENVEMGAYTVRDSAIVRRRYGEVEELFPLVRDRAHDKAGSLSGGQQRLVELARSLMLDPALIVLDEPSIGLDPPTRKTVFHMIRLMNQQGRTILLVEQNARAGLRLSTHGLVLENGKVRLTGTGREILEHPEIGALYLGGACIGPRPPRAGPMTAADPRVRAAVDHWAPRFIAMGVDYNDFVRTTSRIERWEDWLDAWTAVADEHLQLAEDAESAGPSRSAGEAYLHAAICLHFSKFVWVLDAAAHRAATERAIAAMAKAHSFLDPTAERIEATLGDGTLAANLRRPSGASDRRSSS